MYRFARPTRSFRRRGLARSYRHKIGIRRRRVPVVLRIVAFVSSPARWWWRRFDARPLQALLLLVLGIFAVGYALRFLRPQNALIVAPFGLPASISSAIGITEQGMANLVLDDMQEIVDGAFDYGYAEARRVLEEVTGTRRQTLPTQFRLEVSGISIDRVGEEWDRIRQRQSYLEGEVIAGSDSFALRARARGGGRWETRSYAIGVDGLRRASHELAIKVVSAMNPDVAGGFYMSRRMYEAAIARYQQWTTEEPDARQAWLHLGLAQSSNDQVSEAAESYQRAIDIDPGDDARIHRLLGEAQYRLGQVTEAVESFQRAVAVAPDEARAKVALDQATELKRGLTLVQQGRVVEAIQAFAKSRRPFAPLAIPSEAWNLLCWYGSLWEHAADVKHACEKTVEMTDPSDPSYPYRRDSRGLARALMGDFAGAVADFESYVESGVSSDRNRDLRGEWIKALREEQNPLTRQVLEALRKN